MARRLIINADDFGLTLGVNRAIAACHSQGVLTSATLMANSPAFSDAVAIAKSSPNLSVGCHIVLVDGAPLLPPQQIPTLASTDGRFRDSLLNFAAAALLGKISAREIEDEAIAQIHKLQSNGITVSHIDAHKHTHIFPHVFRPLLEAARECGVNAVRNPFVPKRPLPVSHLFPRPRLWSRYVEVKLLRHYRAQFLEQVSKMGMVTTDGCFGIVETGALDATLFDAITGCIPDGAWELVCHPGYNDAGLKVARTRLLDSRATELDVLTSQRARAALEKHELTLISFNDLAHGHVKSATN